MRKIAIRELGLMLYNPQKGQLLTEHSQRVWIVILSEYEKSTKKL